MRAPEKIRVLVFFLFFVALILFAITYRPTNAQSRPADQRNSTLPAGDSPQIKVPEKKETGIGRRPSAQVNSGSHGVAHHQGK